jgi:hypothetical protein
MSSHVTPVIVCHPGSSTHSVGLCEGDNDGSEEVDGEVDGATIRYLLPPQTQHASFADFPL